MGVTLCPRHGCQRGGAGHDVGRGRLRVWMWLRGSGAQPRTASWSRGWVPLGSLSGPCSRTSRGAGGCRSGREAVGPPCGALLRKRALCALCVRVCAAVCARRTEGHTKASLRGRVAAAQPAMFARCRGNGPQATAFALPAYLSADLMSFTHFDAVDDLNLPSRLKLSQVPLSWGTGVLACGVACQGRTRAFPACSL